MAQSIANNISWIHCNICTHLFITKDRRFFVLSCLAKHILCAICMEKTKRGTLCPLCKTGATYMEIAESMNPSAREYFDIKSYSQKVQLIRNIREFQMSHVDKMVTACNFLMDKLQKAEEMKRVKLIQVPEIKDKLRKAKQYRRQLQRHFKQFIYSRIRKDQSSGYGSQIGGNESVFNAPVDNVFEQPQAKTSGFSHFFGNSTPRPSQSGSKLFGATPKATRELFSSQKTSTPTEHSREKVLTQNFSFQSTPSKTVSRIHYYRR